LTCKGDARFRRTLCLADGRVKRIVAVPVLRRRGEGSGEDGGGGDDVADTLRYLVATKARRVIERKLVGL